MDPRMFFGGMGGMPGGHPFGGMGGMRSREPADTQKLYDVLGVSKDADTKTIKKAYRKLAIKNHPDKGGDPAKFQEISRAWEILGDEEKRAVYDAQGEEGVNRRSERGGDRRKRGPNSEATIDCTLEQLYAGCTRNLRITRKAIDKESKIACRVRGCRGGVIIQRVQMMGMIQQMQSHCNRCGGQGFEFDTMQKRETLEVTVPKGAKNGYKTRFSEKANDIPDGIAGDVIVRINEKPHATFQRKGDDLYIKRTISLSDALCGFTTEVTHLDGRKLIIKSAPGDVLQPTSYDPFGDEEGDKWEAFPNTMADSSVEDLAKGEISDVDKIKGVLSPGGQLHGKGIGCFVIYRGNCVFKQCSREQALAAQMPRSGATMYVMADPSAGAAGRMMKAVPGEGMPRGANPFENGNLFIIFDIEFPAAGTLSEAAQAAILASVPRKCTTELQEDAADVEVVNLADVDPYTSYENNKPIESDDEEEDDRRGGQAQECCVM